ncbi:MAG: CDP-glucose 4,6-dehydratase [Actinobacteria bacterium]|nr:CDP-glucose 4,6-dehydratase [Actinomycetota bacterium]
MDFLSAQLLRDLPGPVLITGHTGFKGTWLTLLLEKLEVPVIGYSLAPEVDSLFDRAGRTGVIHEAFSDIRDFAQLNSFIQSHQPSAIIHMAAQPLVLESYKTQRATFETNVMGTVNLLDSVFSTGSVKAVVVVTTDKVYRNDNSGRPFVETDPLAGKDPYSASKVGTEAAVAAWQQIAKVSGGPRVISVRAGNVIGGGDWATDRLLPDLIKSFSGGTELSVRNPSSTRPWQHVLDPLSGYLQALISVLQGIEVASINFGPDSESLSVAEVVGIAKSAWPSSSNVNLKGAEGSEHSEATALALNAKFAEKVLGWTPRWSQQEAVEATVIWWDKVINQGFNPISACQDDINFLLGI